MQSYPRFDHQKYGKETPEFVAEPPVLRFNGAQRPEGCRLAATVPGVSLVPEDMAPTSAPWPAASGIGSAAGWLTAHAVVGKKISVQEVIRTPAPMCALLVSD
jgi:hypothetical protein